MPMVWHDAVRKKCNLVARDGFLQKALERGIVACIFEKSRAFGCPIEDMEDHSRFAFPFPSRHSRLVAATSMPDLAIRLSSKNDLRPHF